MAASCAAAKRKLSSASRTRRSDSRCSYKYRGGVSRCIEHGLLVLKRPANWQLQWSRFGLCRIGAPSWRPCRLCSRHAPSPGFLSAEERSLRELLPVARTEKQSSRRRLKNALLHMFCLAAALRQFSETAETSITAAQCSRLRWLWTSMDLVQTWLGSTAWLQMPTMEGTWASELLST